MPMQLIETTVLTSSVRMRYADNADATKATEWIDFQVPLGLLAEGEPKIDDPELNFLAEIRLAALRRVRDVIGAETQRLSRLAGPMR